MKYIETTFNGIRNITVSTGAGSFESFPVDEANPRYLAFLVQVDLTDEEVHALPTDEWFEV